MTETPVAGAVPRFELAEWRNQFGIVGGVTARGAEAEPFDLGLGGNGPIGKTLDRWRALRTALPGFAATVVARQVHGTTILRHEAATGLVIHEGADGHLTRQPGILLTVTLADCIPVYLVDPVRRVIALLHAGWRGTAAGILVRGVHELIASGSSVDNLLVHCGVGICGSCYEVGPEVFAACGIEAPAGGSGPLDLRRLLLEQAVDMGVEKVSTSQFCSRHHSGFFFSHRASDGCQGRMVAYLGVPT
jgi:purine-nucleoside/S-methyl-5'-thioadenosine phosphorylase / adenosine deaminase